MDKVFGFPGVVRFSWGTASKLITEHCVDVKWQNEEEEDVEDVEDGDEPQKPANKLSNYFGTGVKRAKTDGGSATKKKVALPNSTYFADRQMVKVVDF